jgi:hypothetical protein
LSDKSEAPEGVAEDAGSPELRLELTLVAGLSRALDAWIAIQLEPKPSRAAAVQRLLEEALGSRFGS